MKILRTTVLSLLGAIPLLAGAAGNNWMASKMGGLRVSQLSIPGTHDSGALYEPISGTAKCQNLSIADQLNAGVRFLDIRCRHLNDAFTIHHGSVYQNQNFQDVLNAVYAFLNANPTETVIMSVKEEHTPSGNTRTFEQTFDTYVAGNPSKWRLASDIPTLGEARGKIQLFRRFGAGSLPKGLDASNWPDNTTFTSGSLRVQDAYNVSDNNAKWTAITNLFNESNVGAGTMLYVNFTSGVKSGLFGIPDIPGVSNDINLRLSNYLTSNPGRRYGVVVMDFVDAAKCNLVINNQSLYVDPTFVVVNKASGKTIDLIGGDTANGARINQWTYDFNGPNQRWALVPSDDGQRFLLVSLKSGKCATLPTTGDGAQLVNWDYLGANNPTQQFDLLDAGNGWFKIRNVNSGKVLDVDGPNLNANDAKIQQWTDLGGANQHWRLQPWGDYFVQAMTGKYVCVQNMGSSNGNLIIQYTKENNPWFKWRFESVGEGFLKASSLNALGRVLCVVGGSTANGANTHLWDYNVNNAGDQKLMISPRLNGRHKFYFVHDGMSWDIPGGNGANNVPLQQYPNNANVWQEFLVERVR